MPRLSSILIKPMVPVLLAIMMVPCLMSPVRAQQAPATRPDPEASHGLSGWLGLDLRSLVSGSNLRILGVAGLAAALTWEEADSGESSLRGALDGSALEGLMDVGNLYGSGQFVGSFTVGTLAAGLVSGHDELTRFGVDLGRSLFYSGATTWALKATVNRKRPSGGPFSFPSGHTTAAFSMVPVIWHHGGRTAGLGSGFLACLTPLARLEDNRHYASDVIVGAAIGLVFGRAVISQRRHSSWSDHLVVTDRSLALVWGF